MASTPIGKFDPYAVKFLKLDTTGENYLEWASEFRNYIEMNKLEAAIPAAFDKGDGDGNAPTDIKAMVVTAMRTHMDEGLRKLYAKAKDPNKVWKEIKNDYEDFIKTSRPKYHQAYRNLGVDTCGSLHEYQSKLYDIIYNLELCDPTFKITEADKIEKTIETLGADQHALQTTLRSREFKTFANLMHELREHDVKSKIVREREDSKKRHATMVKAMEAETYMTRTRTAPGIRRRPISKGKVPKPLQVMPSQGERLRKGNPNKAGKRTCFACGSSNHLVVNCEASAAELLRFAMERRDAARGRAESHLISDYAEDCSSMDGDVHQSDFKACDDMMDIDEAEIYALEAGAPKHFALGTEVTPRV